MKMNDFQKDLKMLNLGDFQANEASSLDQTQNGGSNCGGRCFNCFNCFNCFSACQLLEPIANMEQALVNTLNAVVASGASPKEIERILKLIIKKEKILFELLLEECQMTIDADANVDADNDADVNVD
ncbi:heterocycloanthracin/sonorensin family bacteriocin [Metabacillus litoralis]|jgi:hypothetical protein|uniref:heterocycloanthracin/sonorensin family bacteriocin n=1 Tax=Metabacillus litoralis TaxID=152268 RepID=UPI00203F2FDB|nr:heterocycloanthracin/sonorensin family bacteriocin [Metabacillus litoralis]MCM3654489.1 heterocycloanthracin/sonorensin family bacteriocin [Metabacillus litoralis]